MTVGDLANSSKFNFLMNFQLESVKQNRLKTLKTKVKMKGISLNESFELLTCFFGCELKTIIYQLDANKFSMVPLFYGDSYNLVVASCYKRTNPILELVRGLSFR